MVVLARLWAHPVAELAAGCVTREPGGCWGLLQLEEAVWCQPGLVSAITSPRVCRLKPRRGAARRRHMRAEWSGLSWGAMASACPPTATTQPTVPSGPAIFKTVPYAFMLPEIVSTLSLAALSHPAPGSPGLRNLGGALRRILKRALMRNNLISSSLYWPRRADLCG